MHFVILMLIINFLIIFVSVGSLLSYCLRRLNSYSACVSNNVLLSDQKTVNPIVGSANTSTGTVNKRKELPLLNASRFWLGSRAECRMPTDGCNHVFVFKNLPSIPCPWGAGLDACMQRVLYYKISLVTWLCLPLYYFKISNEGKKRNPIDRSDSLSRLFFQCESIKDAVLQIKEAIQ